MNETRGGTIEAHVGERLSGYLDGELTQQDRQRVELHLADCPDCASVLEELRALRQRMGQSGLSQRYADQWREDMDDTGVKLSRGIGWLLLIAAAVVIGGIAVLGFLTDPGIEWFWKLLISGFYLGLTGLFVSVLRQRLIERKTDKYKDVDI